MGATKLSYDVDPKYEMMKIESFAVELVPRSRAEGRMSLVSKESSSSTHDDNFLLH
jgi:hypothetical protein